MIKSYKEAAAEAATTNNELPPAPSESFADNVEVAGNLFEEQRKEFVKSFGVDVVLHSENMVEKTIAKITESRAFFRDKDVVRRALDRAQREMDEKVLEKKEFVDLIKWIVEQHHYTPAGQEVSPHHFIPLGTTGALTTHEMWTMENSMLDLAGETDNTYIQPRSVVEAAIARKKGISDEQIAAVHAACLSPKRVTVIEGTAGAGKSFTMEAVKETYIDMGYDVMGTALGWAAAKVLGESAKLEDENCKAIEGLTRSWLAARANGADPFQGPTLLIVDEAGMVGTRHMSIILEETKRSRYPVKVVLTGDSLQVIPVNAGNALEAIIEFHGTTRIDTIRRQHQPSHRRAVKRFSLQQSGQSIHTFLQQECVHWCKDKDMLLNMVVRNYVSYRLANPNKKSLVLTLSNKDVLELNHRIRAAYKKLGLIGGDDIPLTVNNGIDVFDCNFSVGDEVLLRANDKNMMVYEIDPSKSPLQEETWKAKRLGVFNRNSGRIVAIRRSKKPIGSYDFVIDLGGDTPGRVIINSEKFKSPEKEGMPMIHNYAGTIYGSQGQTVSQVFMIDSPRMDFRLAYVGMSRHKENVEIFLDETELHRRLDGALGKRQSLDSHLKMQQQGKSLEDAKVDLGRYTRAEMLRAVALSWGKHSENLTAVMYERIRRIGKQKFARNAEELARIKPANNSEMIVDFIPEYNQPYPLVDIEKILDLPDPIQESELVRPADVEENKKRYGALDMPVDADDTPLPLPSRSAPQRREHNALLPRVPEPEPTFFGKAFGLLLGGGSKSSAPKSHPTPKTPSAPLRQADPKSAFDDVEGVDEGNQKSSLSLSEIIANLNRWMNPSPKVEIPYAKGVEPCGKVIFPESDSKFEADCREKGIPDPRPHYLSFDGVPQVANVDGGPDPEWLSQQRETLWAVGKFGEPRILSRDPYGNVVARYRLDGTCVVGQGFPPVCINRHGSEKSPVYIVAGAKEWLWLRQTMEEKHAADPSQIPHIIWAAKDADLSMIAPSLIKSTRVVVVRSKADDRQIPWAKDIQDILFTRHKINAVVSPKLPEEEVALVSDEPSVSSSPRPRRP